jgi:hypothetical protein
MCHLPVTGSMAQGGPVAGNKMAADPGVGFRGLEVPVVSSG